MKHMIAVSIESFSTSTCTPDMLVAVLKYTKVLWKISVHKDNLTGS